jgi:hypothetical protein
MVTRNEEIAHLLQALEHSVETVDRLNAVLGGSSRRNAEARRWRPRW